MKKYFLILLTLTFLICNLNFADAKGGRSGFKSYGGYRSYAPKTYKAPKISYPKTYKAPKLSYPKTYAPKTSYSTKGYSDKPKRDPAKKKEFLKSRGYDKNPEGYDVDHIIPLSKGGADEPYNMQLLPREVHKEKTKEDLRGPRERSLESYYEELGIKR